MSRAGPQNTNACPVCHEVMFRLKMDEPVDHGSYEFVQNILNISDYRDEAYIQDGVGRFLTGDYEPHDEFAEYRELGVVSLPLTHGLLLEQQRLIDEDVRVAQLALSIVWFLLGNPMTIDGGWLHPIGRHPVACYIFVVMSAAIQNWSNDQSDGLTVGGITDHLVRAVQTARNHYIEQVAAEPPRGHEGFILDIAKHIKDAIHHHHLRRNLMGDMHIDGGYHILMPGLRAAIALQTQQRVLHQLQQSRTLQAPALD